MLKTFSDETPRERFIRIRPRRMLQVAQAIRLLGNLSTPWTYEFTSEEVKTMFTELRAEIDQCEHKFVRGLNKLSEMRTEDA